MSAETLKKLDEAIRDHVASTKGGVVVDWIIGYAAMNHDSEFGYDYIAGGETPHGGIGLAKITLDQISQDILGCDGDE